MPILYKIYLQFEEIGKLFGKGEFSAVFNGGGLKANNFKTASSISDMENITAQMFNKQFHIGNDGISKWNKSQIEAKANAMSLTESLKNEVVAMASDADMTDKLRAGKLTWAKAIDEAGDGINDVGDALIKSGKLSKEQVEMLEKVMSIGDNKKTVQTLKDITNEVDGLSTSMVSLGSKSASNSFLDNLKNQAKGALVALKAIAPYAAAAAVAYGAFKLWDYSQTGYTRAKEKAEASASTYSEDKSNLQSLQQELDTTKSKIEELNATKEQNLLMELLLIRMRKNIAIVQKFCASLVNITQMELEQLVFMLLIQEVMFLIQLKKLLLYYHILFLDFL